jgi:hypothetical protein
VHRNGLGGVDDVDGQAGGVVLGQLGLEGGFITDEDDFDT